MKTCVGSANRGTMPIKVFLLLLALLLVKSEPGLQLTRGRLLHHGNTEQDSTLSRSNWPYYSFTSIESGAGFMTAISERQMAAAESIHTNYTPVAWKRRQRIHKDKKPNKKITWEQWRSEHREMTENNFRRRKRRQASMAPIVEVFADEYAQNASGRSSDPGGGGRIWAKGLLSSRVTTSILSIAQPFSVVCGIISMVDMVFAIFVFSDNRMASRVVLLVSAFNAAEGLKAAVIVLHRIWKSYLGNTFITWSSPYSAYFSYFVTWLPDAMGRISLVLNLIIIVDRFVVLAFPLKSINRKVIVYPKLTIFLVFFSMVLFQVSSIVIFFTQMANNVNRTHHFMAREIIGELSVTAPSAFAVYRIMHVIASTCFRYIPLIVTITLNIMTIASLVYRNPFKESEAIPNGTEATVPKAQARKRQNNVMIVGSTLVFSFLVAVKPLVRIVGMLHPSFGEGKVEQNMFLVANEIALILDVSSPMITFLAYYKLSSVFRAVFASLFFNPENITRRMKS